MLSTEVKERLAVDVGTWLTDGLISPEVADCLRRRYQANRFTLALFVRYVGLVGGGLVLVGLLGMVGVMAHSKAFSAGVLAAMASFFLYFGLRLDIDPVGRYRHSAKILLALGAVALTASIGVFVSMFGFTDRKVVLSVGIVVLSIVSVLAYLTRNLFLLILALLGLFHWLGSWTGMFGHASYAFDVQDPRLMSLASLGVIGVGLVHEHHLQVRAPRFHEAYQVVGLLYLNVSLLILSIDGWHLDRLLPWVAVFTAATLLQIVAGARLHSPRFLGFGVTFLFIDLFTRFHEHFWDRLGKGLFFLVGGCGLFIAGAVAEQILRRSVRSAS